MYMLIQLLKKQLSLAVTQGLFHAPTGSNHAQLHPEDVTSICLPESTFATEI